MELVGARGQTARDIYYDASGSLSSTSLPALVLPDTLTRSLLLVQNLSAGVMYCEIGAGTATATVSGGAVTSVTVVNGGFNYTIAPEVEFLGGGAGGNSTYVGATDPTAPSPGSGGYGPQSQDTVGNRPAKAHCVLSGGAINSIVVDDGGAGYVTAPFVLIRNSRNDPNGAADPSKNSGSGHYMAASGGSVSFNGTACPTSPVALFSATSGAKYTVKWML